MMTISFSLPVAQLSQLLKFPGETLYIVLCRYLMVVTRKNKYTEFTAYPTPTLQILPAVPRELAYVLSYTDHCNSGRIMRLLERDSLSREEKKKRTVRCLSTQRIQCCRRL